MAYCYVTHQLNQYLAECDHWDRITEEYWDSNQSDTDFPRFIEEYQRDNPGEAPATWDDFMTFVDGYIEEWHEGRLL